jgi:hypothetical protein
MMKNGCAFRFGWAGLAIVALSASGAHAQGVEDSPRPPANAVAALPASPDLISFAYGMPLLDGKPLEGEAFYRLVGRPDLAERYRVRQGRKSGAVAIGLFVTGPALLWGLADVFVHEFKCCGAPPDGSPSLYPWLLVGAGLTSAALGAAIPADPIDLDQRVALAGAHNARVRLLPAFRPDGGGLTVVGSF